MALVLGIETSCDETAAAVVEDGWRVRGSAVASQTELHARFGGVVPEAASRRHVEMLLPVLEEALARAGASLHRVDAVAVTQGPGLIGSLLVGVAAAKAIAWSRGLPLVPVNHLRAHVYAAFLDEPSPPSLPLIALIISGGHTELVRMDGHRSFRLLGSTRDDAAGEAFDKVARLLGLPYPGGPHLDRLAEGGDPAAFPLPRARLGPHSLEFSFSGLKTAVAQLLAARPALRGRPGALADLAASFQAAVADVLVEKALRACRVHGIADLVVAGGVAANTAIRARFEAAAAAAGLRVRYPAPALCTDNAAMVAAAGYPLWREGVRAGWDLVPQADLPLAPAAGGGGRRRRGRVPKAAGARLHR